MDPKPKARKIPGHKRASVSYGVSVTCECGWRSATFYGKGANREAHTDWRIHVDRASHGKAAQ
jgi:hypothetical protein